MSFKFSIFKIIIKSLIYSVPAKTKYLELILSDKDLSLSKGAVIILIQE